LPLAVTLTSNSKALWYMTRGFGLVALILLTVSLVLGLTEAVRFSRPGWPRFVVSALHKNASLLAMVTLTIHIVTALLDSYAPIHIADLFIPFVSQYRPLWLGLGALSLDMMIALVVTSLLRERIGLRTWRAIHWSAYACWPLAVVHGLGTGTDTKLVWVLALNATCTAAVVAALWWRLVRGWSTANPAGRGAALFASVALPIAVAVWTVAGPLGTGWARRAGTPTALLASNSAAGVGAAAKATGQGGPPAVGQLALPLDASFHGTQQESGPNNDGLVSVTIAGTFSGAQRGEITIVLTGQPTSAGGVQLRSSHVALGSVAAPDEFQGEVTQLDGSTLLATLTTAGTGATYTATSSLHLTGGSALTGSVQVAA